MCKLLLIDGSSLLSTAYYATLTPELKFKKVEADKMEEAYKKLLMTSDGKYTNGLYGMLKMFLKLVDAVNPTHVAICWDETRNTFRKELYPDYKGTRSETPAPLREQYQTAKQMFSMIKIQQLSCSNYEADDYAGSVARQFGDKFDDIILYTKDMDYLQLINDNTHVLANVGEKSAIALNEVVDTRGRFAIPKNCYLITKDAVKNKIGVEANQVVDFKSICGDSSDNIPGIKGVGEKIAITLLEEFSGLKAIQQFILNNEEQVVVEKWKSIGLNKGSINAIKKDMDGDKLGRLSYQLAKIKTDIPLDISMNNLEFYITRESMDAMCNYFEFKSLV